MNSKRAWLVWGVGIFAYIVAITHRTSFGVAGLVATERFDATASALSAFTVVQLVVYAGLQIPVGVLVDRFGPRIMIATGAALMAVGQLQLAMAESVPAGVVGRIFVGAGDAMTFIAVIRLIPLWFPARKVPVLTQLTGQVGQLGQLISLVPFAFVLHSAGWSQAFVGLAALGVLACVLSAALVRNAPAGCARDQNQQGHCAKRLPNWARHGGSPEPGWACGATLPPSSPERSLSSPGDIPSWSRARAWTREPPASC